MCGERSWTNIDQGGDVIGSELTGSNASESTVEDVETNDVLETLKNSDSVVSLQSQVSLQSHEDFINSLSTTHTLLLDMAAALRAVTQKEAQEWEKLRWQRRR